MDKNTILKLLKKEESNKLDFKEQFNDKVLKTISAFANSYGGVIVVGVNDKKGIVGININDKNFQEIINKVSNKLGIDPDFEVIEEQNKTLLIIEVKKSFIPISFNGKYYKRIGNTTREMNFEELKSFFQKDLRWERVADRDFKIDEIDEHIVRSFLRTARAKGRLTVFNGDEPIEDVFERLGLMENGKINNAGMLLFGQNPQKYFHYAKVRAVRLKDNITIIGDRWIEGNLFNQFRQTEEAIKNFINVRYEIKGFERKDIWDYPLNAIREAVANALLHRNYFKPVNIQIKIFDDKIWFYNFGGLPEEWDTEKILSSHASMPRNPTIFNVFYLAGIVESVGSGIERMMQSLKEAKLPQPMIDANHSEFTLVFLKDINTKEYLQKLGLNERQVKAVMYVKERGKITNREYQEVNTTTKKTASRDLTELVNFGLFAKVGTTGKGTFYILKRHKGAKGDINGA